MVLSEASAGLCLACPTTLSSPLIRTTINTGSLKRLPTISFITSFHNKTRTTHSSKAVVLQAKYLSLNFFLILVPKSQNHQGTHHTNQVVQLMNITIYNVLVAGKERLAGSLLMPRRGARHSTSVSLAVMVSIPGFLLLPILLFFG